MTKKFIPNGDVDFETMANAFVNTIEASPARFAVSDDDAAALTDAVAAFRVAMQGARGGNRSTVSTAAKEQARLVAEKIIRRIANHIRGNDAIDSVTKLGLGLRERTKQPKATTVPNEAPRLRFLRAIHEGHGEPEHELKFSSRDWKSKPDGAVRLEVFVDLVSPEAEVPLYPGANGSRPIYLRSYTRSPVRLYPPIANVPMRVVYWARWADSAGNVGPFSATAVGWVEGGSHYTKRLYLGQTGKKSPMLHVNVERAAAIVEENSVIVALLTAGRFTAEQRALPEVAEMRQLEAPAEEAA